MTDEPADADRIGGFDPSGRRWVLAMFGLGGAVVGALLPWLARWATELPWMPFQGPLRLLGSFDHAWLLWGWPVLGLVVGLGFAVYVISAAPVLAVADGQIVVRRHGDVERVIARDKVDAVHRVKGKVVIETASGRKLFEDEVEGDRTTIRDTFVAHDYPWEGPAE